MGGSGPLPAQLSGPAKVVLLGDSGVGKTSLYSAIVGTGSFSGAVESTIGAVFGRVDMTNSRGDPVQITLWDTAGQERFRNIVPQYLARTELALLCYDVNDVGTVDGLMQWATLVRESRAGPSVPFIIVGCKSDLPSRVSFDDVLRRKDELNAFMAILVSARTGAAVMDLQLAIGECVSAGRASVAVSALPVNLIVDDPPKARPCC